MSRWRRYVYLLVDRFNKGTHPLRRIDASSLFVQEKTRRKQPWMLFALTSGMVYCLGPTSLSLLHTSIVANSNGILEFCALFGYGRKKSLIAGVDRTGSIGFMYDLAENAIHNLARINEPKGCCPISLPVGDALHVMKRRPLPTCWTQATTRSTASEKPRRWWLQHLGVHAGRGHLLLRHDERVVEYGAWLGFSSPDGLLCSASDLAGAAAAAKKKAASPAPALRYVWMDLRAPAEWTLLKSFLVQLGGGKFCVAKFFSIRSPMRAGRTLSARDMTGSSC
ncbi:hypothetical protein ACP4OV_022578 [Aristida adscensionis]